MKKHILIFVAIFSLLSANLFSQTVYVTKTGKKYHNENCSYLKSSSIPMDLSSATAKGYTACSKCSAKSGSSQPGNSSSKSTETEKQNTNVATEKSTSSVQCTATTKAGNQCSRMTKSSNGKCWQHGGNQ